LGEVGIEYPRLERKRAARRKSGRFAFASWRALGLPYFRGIARNNHVQAHLS